ncbi:MAG: cytochrome c oxidase subunit II [Candidatus Marinimicrobia bacterium]|nr:cytochrome c oxidase subunit II [Candidatus Neomarinimicrobiota bacterium]|tara:strand:- start:4529 stop:5482 length:954 start_codon:yes stop_codon:yes gene_type:complete
MFLNATEQTTWLPQQASTVASEVDSLFYFIYYWTIIFLAIVAFCVFYFSWKYRNRDNTKKLKSSSHNTILEVTWTFIPFVLVMIVFFWGAGTYMKMNVIPYGAMEINVTAQKWAWNFKYKEGFANPRDLVVPVNTPIKLVMQSQDVLHSFYVPEFRVKMDIIPNRYMMTWFEATKVGEYDLLCTEYCGASHSEMLGKVIVKSQEDYEDWVEKANVIDESIPLVEVGETAYKKHACNTCHSIDGSSMIGPSFKGIWNTMAEHVSTEDKLVDENYIRESILYPQKHIVKGYENGNMPSYKGLIKDREIEGVIEYIKSLK